MSRYSRIGLAVLFALGVAAAPGGGDKKKAVQEAVEKELKGLQGTWEQVSIETNGEKEGFAKGMAPLFIIQRDSYRVEVGGKELERGRLKLNPAANPRQCDLIVMDGATQTRTYPGIYEITGDKLRSCFTRDGGNRPTGFTAGLDSGRALAVYRRVSIKK
jgi:uncharacterized protein (TIGR03067 family)